MNEQHIVVAGILLENSKVLVIQRAENEDSDPGYWEVPRGQVEFGESADVALRRECMEEVHLKVTPLTIVDSKSFTYSRGNKEIHVIELTYLMKLEDNESLESLQLSRDHGAWRLISKAEVSQLEPMQEYTKQLLLSTF